MQVTAMEILGFDGESRPILALTRRRRDALSAYVERRWPVGRRKAVMAEWDLTNDEARAVIEGTASEATWEKVVQHPKGGWAVVLPILGAVVGQSFDQFIAQEARRRADAGQRYLADARHLSQVARDLPSHLPVLGAAGADQPDAGRDRSRRAAAGRPRHDRG